MAKAQEVRGHLTGVLEILCKWKLLTKQLPGSNPELTWWKLKLIHYSQRLSQMTGRLDADKLGYSDKR